MVERTITASSGWTTAQVLTPILVAFFLCLVFILYLLHKKGHLSRLTSSLPFMRGVRARGHRQWDVDGEINVFPHTPDAEATPMISQPHHRNFFRSDRQHPTSRIKQIMATPAIT